MQENSLHASIKKLIAGNLGKEEVLVDGYFIDVILDDLLVEVQTRSFSSIKKKLYALVPRYTILLVHPIPFEKWIIHLAPEGDEIFSRRKSTHRGRYEDIFNELIRFPDLLMHPNFSLELILTREEEIRRDDGLGSWRRRGQSITDRRLLEVLDRRLISRPRDFLGWLPGELELPFTNQDLARLGKMQIQLARKMTYSLRKMGVLQECGKNQRELLMTVSKVT